MTDVRPIKRVEAIAFTRKGCELALRLAAGLERWAGGEATVKVSGPARLAGELGISAYESLGGWTARSFATSDALLFVGASGIAVRAIAPHVRDKFSDPAVVSIDECGRYAVPLLSGHVGGANEMARAVAGIAGGQAAVSTATDVNGLFAVDEWARERGLAIVERDVAKRISARLLEGGSIGFTSDFECDWELPEGVIAGSHDLGFSITLDESSRPHEETLHLVPRVVCVGVGCRKGASPEVVRDAVDRALANASVSPRAVRALATIDVKRGEPAIEELARARAWELRYYTADELAAVPGEFAGSEFVQKTVGVDNVCERAACAGGARLVLGKQAGDGVTVAIAMEEGCARG